MVHSRSPIGSTEKGQLLTTKIYIPQIYTASIPRPRLISQINEGIRGKLVVISAPAGFGKTTLLSDWSQKSSWPVAWVSLDEGDNDLVFFLNYFIAALQSIQLFEGKSTLDLLQSTQPLFIESILTAIINEIAATSAPFVLVLDDYHRIENQQIHDAMMFLLDYLPPQMHLIISSRADLPIPLSRLRASRQVLELHAADLRFTSDEAALFLNGLIGLNLSPHDIIALETRTEGWIAGLQLAALSMKDHTDIPGFIAVFTGSNRYILDYLIEEVFQRQPQSIQNFLLRTSILDRLTGPLCAAVTESSDGQATLEYIARANLFLVRLDDEQRWYRYHHLFADALRLRLQQSLSAAEIAELHNRASQWYERQGYIVESIDHALEAMNYGRAGRLIEQNAEATLMRGEVRTLLTWLKRLPDEEFGPRHYVFYVISLLLFGKLVDAVHYLQIVKGRFGNDPEMKDEIDIVASTVALFQGDPSLIAALQPIQSHEHILRKSFMRSLMNFNIALSAALNGDVILSNQTLNEVVAITQATGNILMQALCSVMLASLEVLEGRLQEAARVYRQIIQFSAEQPVVIACMAYLGLGEIYREQNDLEGAVEYLTQGIALGKQWDNFELLVDGYVSLARVAQARGNFEQAFQIMEQTRQLALRQPSAVWTLATVEMYFARLWIAGGNLEAAVQWTQNMYSLSELSPSFMGEVEGVVLARLYIAQHRLDDALELLEKLRRSTEAFGQLGTLIEVLILCALAYQQQGNLSQATADLEKALSLAQPEGYVRIFADEGPAMAALLSKLLDKQPEGYSTDYVYLLLRALGHSSAPARPPTVFNETFSEREIEVLRLLSAGYSNQDIANQLVVAISTVKWHIYNIFNKLGVRSRTQAILRAKELNLI